MPAQDRAGVRAAAEEGPGDRSGKGPVEPPGHARLSAARARAARPDRREVFEVRCQLAWRLHVALEKSHSYSSRSPLSSPASLWAAITVKMATQAPVNSSWHKALLDMGAEWEAKTQRPREAHGLRRRHARQRGRHDPHDAAGRRSAAGEPADAAGARGSSTRPSTSSASRSSFSPTPKASTSSRS